MGKPETPNFPGPKPGQEFILSNFRIRYGPGKILPGSTGSGKYYSGSGKFTFGPGNAKVVREKNKMGNN